MEGKYYLDKLYICNFKPFAYRDSGDKPYYEIDFGQGDSRVSMILSGPNGYGKSSIFQAIEFALMGAQPAGSYMDKIKKIKEHIFINNLEKPCFVALQLRSEAKGAVTIIRYAEKGEVDNRVEDQRGAADFRTYIFEDAFTHQQWELVSRHSDSLQEATKEELSGRLGEKSIEDWLKRNYVKQEQENAFIMKKDQERVNLLKGFTDEELKHYFERFEDEKTAVLEQCKELKVKLQVFLGKIKDGVKAVQGEKPVCGKVTEEVLFDWDKAEYQESDPFAEYAHKAERALGYVKNIDIYRKHYCAELLSAIKNKEAYYREYILSLFEPSKITEYRDSYQRGIYLRRFIEDEENFYTSPLNKTYLSDKLITEIETVRERKQSFQKALNEKQRIYKRFEELHRSIVGKEATVEEVFGENCPLCGSGLQNRGKSLSRAIVEAAKMVQDMKDVLDKSLEGQERSISDAFLSVKKMIETEAGKEKEDKEVYEAIENMERHTDQLNQLKRELGELILLNVQGGNGEALCFANSAVFQTKYRDAGSLKEIADTLKGMIDGVELDNEEEAGIFDMQAYLENKRHTPVIGNMAEGMAEQIEQKIKQLKWLALEKEAKEYSHNKDEYDRLSEEYRKTYERKLKLDKIVGCKERAKKKYMENVAKYLEIPLYIYSGKLMQTSQNDLGITCFTGGKKDELTQFKVTAGQNEGRGKLDITEKFSAGQRAVANIALILAMKKIALANLDVFMIDDPCQSLDELNIASFVEIMKNEFDDTQLILSTHEDKIAAYMKYIFEKRNKKMRIFNVQERLYGTS